jgi:hypothetical protein
MQLWSATLALSACRGRGPCWSTGAVPSGFRLQGERGSGGGPTAGSTALERRRNALCPLYHQSKAAGGGNLLALTLLYPALRADSTEQIDSQVDSQVDSQASADSTEQTDSQMDSQIGSQIDSQSAVVQIAQNRLTHRSTHRVKIAQNRWRWTRR